MDYIDLNKDSSFDTYGLNQNDISRLNTVGQQFSNQFQNLVGRAPSDAEFNTFVGQYVNPNRSTLLDKGSPQSQMSSSYLNDFINTNFQQAAKDTAMSQLQAQQGQANDLSNLFRKQGTDAINNTEQSLLDYQSKLFDKLRPNLITSLQSQGLLNTGGLNQAMAGAQADMANSASGALMDARLQNEQQANAIAFGGASAPYQYQQAQIMNSLPYLQQQGQQGMQQGYNTFMDNLNFQHQMALAHQQAQDQRGMQPSFLRTLGQSFAGSFGGALGQASGAGINSTLFGQKSPPPGGASAMAGALG